MPTVQSICEFLDEFAPPALAEEWDNVGLLVGDRCGDVRSMMTCLTITPASCAEAIEGSVDLIVTHHPLPFRPLKKLTTDTTAGRLLLDLIGAGISVYSPHTAFDSAAEGINQHLATGLGLTEIQPLVIAEQVSTELGAGRFGQLASSRSILELVVQVKKLLSVDGLHVVGGRDRTVQTVAVACGSAGEFLAPARAAGCDVLVTGETNFHTCLEAESTGVSLLLPGHYASERFAVERLADVLAGQFADIHVWASQNESDPLEWIEH